MPPDADADDDDSHGHGVPPPGRRYAAEPLIDAFGPVLGHDPTRPFHPHDDRIVSLGLHHTTDTGIAHDVMIDAWWSSL